MPDFQMGNKWAKMIQSDTEKGIAFLCYKNLSI